MANAGRPTKMDEITIAKLKMAFSAGLSDLEACSIADIDKSTLYRYQKKHPEFATEKVNWKNNLQAQAKLTVAKAIINQRDVKTAKWLLDKESKKEKALSSKFRYEARKAKAEADVAKAKSDLMTGGSGSTEHTVIVDDFSEGAKDDKEE